MHMKEPLWVLLYLIDQDAWWPHEAPHKDNYHPDIHTYCFRTEQEAEDHRKKLTHPGFYRVKKTYLQ